MFVLAGADPSVNSAGFRKACGDSPVSVSPAEKPVLRRTERWSVAGLKLLMTGPVAELPARNANVSVPPPPVTRPSPCRPTASVPLPRDTALPVPDSRNVSAPLPPVMLLALPNMTAVAVPSLVRKVLLLPAIAR